MAGTRLGTLKLSSGERYPVLLLADGSPHETATLYVTTQVRNTGRASNTCKAILTAVRFGLAWADARGIDLESRFSKNQFLTGEEIDSLGAVTHLRSRRGGDPLAGWEDGTIAAAARGLDPGHELESVSTGARYVRLTYIAKFLRWLGRHVHERGGRHLTRDTRVALDDMDRQLKELKGRAPRYACVSAPKGLSEEAIERLEDLVEPDAEENPFSTNVQARNHIIISLFRDLGIRLGELAALKITDFDFQTNTVTVARRHDDIEDPRINQPVAKTLDRVLAMTDAVAGFVLKYILDVRARTPGAKRHPFLFVVHKRGPSIGRPISMKGIDKIFLQLRASEPQLLGAVRPHRLRHTRNEKAVSEMDKNEVDHVKQDKILEYTNGWQPGSGTAATYTRGHIEKAARKAMLELSKPTVRPK